MEMATSHMKYVAKLEKEHTSVEIRKAELSVAKKKGDDEGVELLQRAMKVRTLQRQYRLLIEEAKAKAKEIWREQNELRGVFVTVIHAR
jgi:hypothetical protein